MLNKKAQQAIEFLMTYGWAVLVVLIAVGALAYFINPKELICNGCHCRNVNQTHISNDFIEGQEYYLCANLINVTIDKTWNIIKEEKNLYLYKCVNDTLEFIQQR